MTGSDRAVARMRGGVKLAVVISVAVILLLAVVVGVIAWARMSHGFYYIASGAMAPTLNVNDHIVVDKLAYRHAEPKVGDVVVFSPPAKAGPTAGESVWVKRVMGLPGDTIRITKGCIVVDGTKFVREEYETLLSGAKVVRLFADHIEADGESVTKKDLAGRLGVRESQIKIVPGVVYRNGKALYEPYVMEDCGMDYPCETTDPSLVVSVDGEACVKIPEGTYLLMGDNRNDSNDGRFWGPLEESRIVGKATSIVSPPERAGPVR